MHVEAGLRSHNLLDPFPEEIMRVLTARFSDFHACPNDWAVDNLRKVNGIKLNTGQNLMRDSLAYGLEKVKDNPVYASRLRELGVPDEFALVSIHRYENIFRRKRLERVMGLLLRIAGRISLVIVMHPSTQRQLLRTGWMEKLTANPTIVLLPRQDFMTFVALVQHARFVITDGGSNQEEMSYIGKPTLIFRKVTERREGIGRNAVISRFDESVIDDFVANYRKYEYPPQQTDESPARMVVEWISRFVRGGSLAGPDCDGRARALASI
jgi:UDP-N-acetylglucosamine 2-epimerase (non-hydrolysing)